MKTVKKIIDLPEEVKVALLHQAVDANTNLKNYIEALCCFLAQKNKSDALVTDLQRFLNQ
jgi:hypothetical protein